MVSIHATGPAPVQNSCARGPCVVEAARCPVCDCPADEPPYCSDRCQDLDESRQHVRVLRDELHRARMLGRDEASHRLAIELGAALRHRDDLDAGDDGWTRTTLEWATHCLDRVLAGGTREER